jgi:hypothetical protein
METERSVLMAKVIVTVEGGLIQGAILLKNEFFPGKIDGVIVIDFDTQGADEDELVEAIGFSGEKLLALAHEEQIQSTEDCDAVRVAMALLEPTIVAKAKKKDLPLLVSQLKTEAGKKALEERLKS